MDKAAGTGFMKSGDPRHTRELTACKYCKKYHDAAAVNHSLPTQEHGETTVERLSTQQGSLVNRATQPDTREDWKTPAPHHSPQFSNWQSSTCTIILFKSSLGLEVGDAT